MYRQQPDFGSDRAARMIAIVREELSPAEISDLIGTRSEPWERDWYAAYAHHNPQLRSGVWLRDAIEAYLDSGPELEDRSAWAEDMAARAKEAS